MTQDKYADERRMYPCSKHLEIQRVAVAPGMLPEIDIFKRIPFHIRSFKDLYDMHLNN